jgi:hypothetical protein
VKKFFKIKFTGRRKGGARDMENESEKWERGQWNNLHGDLGPQIESGEKIK